MKLLLTNALLFLSISFSALAGTGGPDAFGYSWEDSAEVGGPEFQWVEMTDSEVILNADSAGTGAWVGLPGPALVFYGLEEPEVMVSKNGYLTFSETDTGADVTNDCPLPTAPGTDSGRRIAVLHDHLLFGAGLPGSAERGRIEMQYFASSPHPHHVCGVTVISWLNMTHSGDTERFDFQLLLFDNFDIIMQFGENPENGSGSSTGLQRNNSEGIEVVCDTAGSIPDEYAVLFEPPTVVVDSANDDTGALTTTLRSALLSAGMGSKIVFDPSLNGASILRDPTRPRLGEDRAEPVSIDAAGLAGGVAIDGGGEVALYTANGRTHFSNVSFLAGKGSEGILHGGILIETGSTSNSTVLVTISDCRFEDIEGAEAAAGGAVRVGVDCGAIVYGSTFDGNSAKFGGGINVAIGAVLRVEACDFRNNSVSLHGGGIHSQGAVTIRGCEFSGNSAEEGGGLSVFQQASEDDSTQTSTIIEDCLFVGNSAIFNASAIKINGDVGESPAVTITNTTFSENIGDFGSAVRVDRGSLVLRHSTFFANSPRSLAVDSGHSASIGHCVFAGADDYFFDADGVSSAGFNVFDLDTLLDDEDDIEDVDVMLAPLANNGGLVRTHALLPGSPVIDAGDSNISGEPEADARGYDRVVGVAIDPGAYEFLGNLVVTTAVDEEVTPGTGLSLREAVRDVSPGGVVTFDPALNGATIALDASTISIGRDVAIDASALADGITIDGGGVNRVLIVSGLAAVSLHNVDLVGGASFGASGGAGLQVQVGAAVSMFDSSVRGCSAAGPGGGIAVFLNGDLLMVDCVVSGNETTNIEADGGGIYVNDSGLELKRTTVGNNVSSGDGGGIRVTSNSNLTLGRCTIAKNTATGNGGGISCNESDGEVSNSTISGNVAGIAGGAFYGTNSGVRFQFSTIADNRAASTAGGMVTASFQGGGRPTLTHCIVAANRLVGTGLKNIRAVDQDAEPESEGYNLIDDDSFSNTIATDLTERVAYLAPLANYGSDLQTHALLNISPAIDAGDPAGEDAPGRDQRGYGRIVDGRNTGAGRIDIGAHEAAAPVFVGDLLDVVDGAGQRSLRGAIDEVDAGGRIVFKQSLNGGVIDLSTVGGGQGTQLLIDKSIQIDATGLSDGVTVSGGDESRVFDITGGADVAMHALRVEDGFTGASADGGGFRISGNADLLLTHGSVSGNRARDGGAFHVSGGGSARLQNVTVSGNTAQREGAAIKLVGAAASAKLEHCSVVDQILAGAGTVGGFGIGAGSLSLYSTVVANTPGAILAADNSDYSNFTSLGYNLSDGSGALIGGLLVEPGDQTNVNPNVTVLQDIGGWAKVHRYQASSALRNAGDPEPSLLPALSATGGVRSVGRMDIGAEERNGREADADGDMMPDYWENLYGFDINDATDAAEDADLDADSNLIEFQNGTNPVQSLSAPVPPIVVSYEDDTAVIYITLKTQPGVRYLAEDSEDLIHWAAPLSFSGSLNQTTTTYLLSMVGERRYVRFSLSPEQD